MDWALETIPMAQPILPTSEYPVVYRSAISMELSCYIICSSYEHLYAETLILNNKILLQDIIFFKHNNKTNPYGRLSNSCYTHCIVIYVDNISAVS
jgi:hypothetical protein